MTRFNPKIISNYIIDWLNNYIHELPIKGFVLGVSGGVDSAVVASLCARTNKKVLLLTMPIHQAESEYSRAKAQIAKLEDEFHNVESLDIQLTEVFDLFKSTLPSNVQQDELSLANARSRLRMTTLYSIAQTHQLLVAGTGNKIEDFGIGFFTKYGDGGVDINPIGDLLKSEVYELASYLNVIEAIRTAKPTDGLWGDNRSDEDQIGASYEELEFAFMYDGNDEDLSPRQKEVMKIYRRLNKVNKHKVTPIPVCDISHLR